MDILDCLERAMTGRVTVNPWRRFVITVGGIAITSLFGWVMLIQGGQASQNTQIDANTKGVEALREIPERMRGVEERMKQAETNQGRMIQSLDDMNRSLGRIEGKLNTQ